VLLLGPEGSGKSTCFKALAEQGRGVMAALDALERIPMDALLLLEDVDRWTPAEQAQLGVFLGRHPQRPVLMSSRGGAVASGPELVSDSGPLLLTPTAALAEATRGALPLALLESVQWLVLLETPGVALLRELARRELEARGDCQLSDEALTALAEAAARSPRFGHELRALLGRLPPGAWRLGKGQP
jgi:hypothetical protein